MPHVEKGSFCGVVLVCPRRGTVRHVHQQRGWRNRLDRAWKLDWIDRDHVIRRTTKLQKWTNPVGRLWTLLESTQRADADFSFFADTPGLDEKAAIRRVVEAAPNLEAVRVGADTDSDDFFGSLRRQLESVACYHRNPESVKVFCFKCFNASLRNADDRDYWTRVNATLMTKVVTTFHRVERAS